MRVPVQDYLAWRGVLDQGEGESACLLEHGAVPVLGRLERAVDEGEQRPRLLRRGVRLADCARQIPGDREQVGERVDLGLRRGGGGVQRRPEALEERRADLLGMVEHAHVAAPVGRTEDPHLLVVIAAVPAELQHGGADAATVHLEHRQLRTVGEGPDDPEVPAPQGRAETAGERVDELAGPRRGRPGSGADQGEDVLRLHGAQAPSRGASPPSPAASSTRPSGR